MAEAILEREEIGKFRASVATNLQGKFILMRPIFSKASTTQPTLQIENWDAFAADNAPVMDFVFTFATHSERNLPGVARPADVCALGRHRSGRRKVQRPNAATPSRTTGC